VSNMEGSQELIQLHRDVEAYIVPSGDKVTLRKDEPVRITQALGGAYTIVLNGNMFQIAGQNGDALGFDVQEQAETTDDENQQLDEQMIWDQLKSVYDPEIPVNIVDLGLIYDLQILPLEPKGNKNSHKDDLNRSRLWDGAGHSSER